MVGEEEFRQADRRALAVQLLLDTAIARRAAQTDVDPARLRDFWLDSIPENLASLLELRKLAVTAVRIHPTGRSTTYFPSKNDVEAQDLEHTTRHTLRVDGVHKQDDLWGFVNTTNFGPSMRGISVFGRRLKSREQRSRRQPNLSVSIRDSNVETAAFVAEAPTLAILEPAQYEYWQQNMPEFIRALAAILVALIGGSAVTINCCPRPEPENPEEEADAVPAPVPEDVQEDAAAPPLPPPGDGAHEVHRGPWGHLQRLQRERMLRQSPVACQNCGSTLKSTAGSNNLQIRVKCARCRRVLLLEATVQ